MLQMLHMFAIACMIRTSTWCSGYRSTEAVTKLKAADAWLTLSLETLPTCSMSICCVALVSRLLLLTALSPLEIKVSIHLIAMDVCRDVQLCSQSIIWTLLVAIPVLMHAAWLATQECAQPAAER